MGGKFSFRNQEECDYYARFFSEVTRTNIEATFWSLFVFVIILLSVSSRSFTKSEHVARSISDAEKDIVLSFSDIEAERAAHRRMQVKCVAVTSICSLLTLIAVIIEAFAGFAIEFCHGEDLMHFYWGFWTVIQVGSLIAILGINFSQVYALTDNKNPPWSVALGTPVLVIAAVAHMTQNTISAAWKEFRGRRGQTTSGVGSGALSTSSTFDVRSGGPSNHLSRASTCQNPSTILIGLTTDNVPLFLVPTRPEGLPDGSRVVGSIKGGYIVQHGQESGLGSPTLSTIPGQSSRSEAPTRRGSVTSAQR